MPFLELFDETLDINSTENYELSVQISYESLAFCLLDSIRNKFVLIRVFEPDENNHFTSERVDDLISKDDFLTRHYRKIRVLTPSKKFTLIPAPLFDPGKKDEYFRFNHITDDHDIIIANKLSDPDAYLVFSVPKPLRDLINNYYPGVHPLHHIKPLLEHIFLRRKSVHGNYIHIHFEKEFFNLIIFDHNALKFCNTFNYRDSTDILYFVLNAFKNLDVKQEATIYFSGITDKYDDLSTGFSKYVRYIKFSEPEGSYSFSYVFSETELHRFLTLFSTINCE